MQLTPVATKSSITSTLAPGLVTAVLDIHNSSPPVLFAPVYSLKYSFPVTALGNLPFFLIITNGFFNAKAIGGPIIKPLASTHRKINLNDTYIIMM